MGCIKKIIDSRLRKVILALYSALLTPHMGYCVWAPQFKKDRKVLDGVQQRTIKVIMDLEYLSYEDRFKDLRLISLEKRILRGDLINAHKYLKGGHQRDWIRLFLSVPSDRTKG